MSLQILNDQLRFAMANEIAHAAACIDALKSIHAPAVRDNATIHSAKLHDIVALLAGSRCVEIYALGEIAEHLASGAAIMPPDPLLL